MLPDFSTIFQAVYTLFLPVAYAIIMAGLVPTEILSF